MLIAIDHGNKQVKTVHGNAIVSGVQKSKTRPYGRDVLKYGGSYYTLSAQRIPYQKDKTTDERFFILSLFAIAEEIEAQGAYTSGLMPIDLAIGLPPAHFGAQNKAFVRYFKRKEPIYFSYRDKLYSILIRNVQCYPQAFAAAAMILGELATVPRALILDVGGFTADYLLLTRETLTAEGLSSFFRPGVRVLLAEDPVDPEEAAEYLRSRKVGVQLKKLGQTRQILPELSEKNSRLELDTSVGVSYRG